MYQSYCICSKFLREVEWKISLAPSHMYVIIFSISCPYIILFLFTEPYPQYLYFWFPFQSPTSYRKTSKHFLIFFFYCVGLYCSHSQAIFLSTCQVDLSDHCQLVRPYEIYDEQNTITCPYSAQKRKLTARNTQNVFPC